MTRTQMHSPMYTHIHAYTHTHTQFVKLFRRLQGKGAGGVANTTPLTRPTFRAGTVYVRVCVCVRVCVYVYVCNYCVSLCVCMFVCVQEKGAGGVANTAPLTRPTFRAGNHYIHLR
jgi:hypothetical protein